MKKKIFVRKKHIKFGVPDNPSLCMVALAIKDAGFYNVAVQDFDVTLAASKLGFASTHRLPKKAYKQIQRFDEAPTKKDRLKIKPFSFNLVLD